MIRPLVTLHLVEKLRQNVAVYPPYVPVLFLILAQSEIGFLSRVLQHFVLGINDIDHQFPLFRLLVKVSRLAHKFSARIV